MAEEDCKLMHKAFIENKWAGRNNSQFLHLVDGIGFEPTTSTMST